MGDLPPARALDSPHVETRDLEAGAAVIGEPENFHLGLRYADGRPRTAYYTATWPS